MPVYEYTAINPKGKRVKGSIDSDTLRAARQKLRIQGIYPTEIKEGIELSHSKSRDVKRYFQSNRITGKDLAIATRQLATLVGAGLPLVSALQALSDQTDSVVLKRIIIDVREGVEEGLSLAKALGNFPKSFPRLYVNLVAAGEASGTLDTVLDNLADYLEGQLELKRRVTSAMIYPTAMLIICTLVIIGLLVFIVPQVVEIFHRQGIALPLPTRITIGISEFLASYWLLLLALGLCFIVLCRWYYRQPDGRRRVDRLLLQLPIFGSLYIKVITARVSLTLGTLLGSGVGLLTGLEIVKNIVGNVLVTDLLEQARDGVQGGRSLAAELSKGGIFPNMLSHMVAVGEQSGELEGMLTKAGKSYENEVNAALSGLTSLLEPLMMIGVGVIVLCIVISVLLPMVDLIDAVAM